MASDIVERLRERPSRHAAETEDQAKARRQREREEGADTIATLSATNERLRAALEPFAKAANCYDDGVRGSNMPRTGVWYGWKMGKGIEAELTVENLRDARAALAQEKKDG